jgi:hypothetical protein
MIEVSSEEAFNTFLAVARPGERAMYYRGFLARNTCNAQTWKTVCAARTALQKKQVSLVQRRVGEFCCEYLAERR